MTHNIHYFDSLSHSFSLSDPLLICGVNFYVCGHFSTHFWSRSPRIPQQPQSVFEGFLYSFSEAKTEPRPQTTQYKLVVLRDQSMDKTLLDVMEGKVTSAPLPHMAYTPDWKPEPEEDESFTVIEVPALSVSNSLSFSR